MPNVVTPIDLKAAIYKDVNCNYEESINHILLTDIGAVNGQIFNVLSTTVGEAYFEPEFGSYFHSQLFEPGDDETEWKLSIDLHMALNKWLGSRLRTSPQGVRVTRDLTGRSATVYIEYEIIGLGIQVSSSFNIRG